MARFIPNAEIHRLRAARAQVRLTGTGQFGAIQAVARSVGVELRPLDLHDPGEIEHGIATFARGSNNGLIVTGSPTPTSEGKRTGALSRLTNNSIVTTNLHPNNVGIVPAR